MCVIFLRDLFLTYLYLSGTIYNWWSLHPHIVVTDWEELPRSLDGPARTRSSTTFLEGLGPSELAGDGGGARAPEATGGPRTLPVVRRRGPGAEQLRTGPLRLFLTPQWSRASFDRVVRSLKCSLIHKDE